MNRMKLVAAAVMLGGVLALASAAGAQSAAFDQLSPVNQRIAQAVFEVQGAKATLSLEELAAMRIAGTTWGEIFYDLLGRDLITEKKLSQLMKQHKADLELAARAPGATR